MWLQKGAVWTQTGRVGHDGRPVTLPSMVKPLLTQEHTPSHVGIKQTISNLNQWWHPFLAATVKEFIANCRVCSIHNVRAGVKCAAGVFPPRGPGEEVVIDYTDMGERVEGKRYLLVFMNVFSGWPKEWPTGEEDLISVID